MLNIEIIKFEAQDVITASTARCICPDHPGNFVYEGSDEAKAAAEACQKNQHPGCNYDGVHNCVHIT